MRFRIVLSLALVGAAPVLLRGAPATAKDAGAPDAGPPYPACLQVTTSAPYRGLGYNHIVTLASSCPKTLDCTVKTDVNPTPTSATVRPKETVEVVTFIGSPAYTFKADVRCRER
jgi:hypothetical protein